MFRQEDNVTLVLSNVGCVVHELTHEVDSEANGDNRIAILIPCHRVIGADGKLTGYGGGLWRKQSRLDQEKTTATRYPHSKVAAQRI